VSSFEVIGLFTTILATALFIGAVLIFGTLGVVVAWRCFWIGWEVERQRAPQRETEFAQALEEAL